MILLLFSTPVPGIAMLDPIYTGHIAMVFQGDTANAEQGHIADTVGGLPEEVTA